MGSRFDEEEDLLYVQLLDAEIKGGRLTEDHRKTIDLDANGNVRGVMFLYVSEGVDLEGIPEEVQGAVSAELEGYDIKFAQPA